MSEVNTTVQIVEPETQKTEATDRVRQGVTGHGVRYVLLFSLFGVIVAFSLLLML